MAAAERRQRKELRHQCKVEVELIESRRGSSRRPRKSRKPTRRKGPEESSLYAREIAKCLEEADAQCDVELSGRRSCRPRSSPLLEPCSPLMILQEAYGITNNRERERYFGKPKRQSDRPVARTGKRGSRRAGTEIQPPRNFFRPRDLVISTPFPLHPPLFVGVVHRGADLLGWESARGEFGGRFREFSSGCRPREGGKEGVREGLVVHTHNRRSVSLVQVFIEVQATEPSAHLSRRDSFPRVVGEHALQEVDRLGRSGAEEQAQIVFGFLFKGRARSQFRKTLRFARAWETLSSLSRIWTRKGG